METLIKKYEDMTKEIEIPSKYDLYLDEMVEFMQIIKNAKGDDIPNLLHYIYKMGFKKGQNYQKRKEDSKKCQNARR